MDSAWISAFSAVMGSLVGGFTTFVTTYLDIEDPLKEFGEACRNELNKLYRVAT